MEIISDFKNLLGLEIHCRIYNPDATRTIVCWHGLARNGFDFDDLARRLAQNNIRVICPDTPGRGLSEWLDANDSLGYDFALYVPLAHAIMDAYQAHTVEWIGTSMGGLLGMLLASDTEKSRITKLVINDIGPELPTAALERIIKYVGNDIPEFDHFSDFLTYMKALYSTMGPRSETEWIEFAMASLRRTDQGKYTVHYDKNIVGQFDRSAPQPDLWQQYQAISCPVMLIQGSISDVLPDALLQKMQDQIPKAKTHIFEGCAHPPGLHGALQTGPVVDFILQG